MDSIKRKTPSALVRLAALCLVLSLQASVHAQVHARDDTPPSSEEARLLALLDEFLAQAALDDPVTHDRFWAEDLIYTSSAGRRFGKQDIMEGLDTTGVDPDALQLRYWAEDQKVMVFGDTAVVAFRLMAESRPDPAGEPETAQYYNTGTFVRRNGQWRAVAWQATRIPDPE